MVWLAVAHLEMVARMDVVGLAEAPAEEKVAEIRVEEQEAAESAAVELEVAGLAQEVVRVVGGEVTLVQPAEAVAAAVLLEPRVEAGKLSSASLHKATYRAQSRVDRRVLRLAYNILDGRRLGRRWRSSGRQLAEQAAIPRNHRSAALWDERRGRTPVDTPTNAPPEPGPSHTEALAGHRHTDARTIPKGASLPRHPTLYCRCVVCGVSCSGLWSRRLERSLGKCIKPKSI